MMISKTSPSRPVLLVGVALVLWLSPWRSSLALGAEHVGPPVDFRHGQLRVSPDGHYLVHKDGTPFFYLGDTAWELFHRLNREEAERYLENRRQKGFTVIQAVVLAELDGLNTPNSYGHKPLEKNDPTRPNEDYFKHVDYIVKLAESKGMYIGMLPAWVRWVAWDQTRIFNLHNARPYARFLGSRYKKSPNIIWILGGDMLIEKPENLFIWREVAKGLKEGDGGRHLMTYHPRGGRNSSQWLHNEPWLDFNMMQTGHARRDPDNYNRIGIDYNLVPTKPTMDGEPPYELFPVNFALKPKTGRFDAFDVRQTAYWAVFAGAFGHTYGCNEVWQMYAPGREPVRHNPTAPWHELLDLPGAAQMLHLRRLIESRPTLSRKPDNSLLEEPSADGPEHVEACRGEGYAYFYLPAGKPVTVKLEKLSGKQLRAWWYDPREGKATLIGNFLNTGTREFTPPGTPGRGNDWVLVLDDVDKKFPPPGGSDLS